MSAILPDGLYLRAVSVLLSAGILAGCAVVSSGETAPGTRPSGPGILYSLPRADLVMTLTDRDGQAVITVSQPNYGADNNYSYLLRYNSSPFSHDTVKVELDKDTRLLSLVDVKAEDRTRDVLIELAKAVALFEAAEQENDQVLIKLRVDPADQLSVDRFVAAANRAMSVHGSLKFKEKKCAPSSVSLPCSGYEQMRNGAGLRLDVVRPQPYFAAPADCTVGICYRVAMPYRLSVSFANGVSQEEQVYLPNAMPPVAIDVSRSAFVTSTTKLTFQNGMLATKEFDKPSEALAIASTPVEIAKAVLTVVTDFIKLRIDQTSQATSFAEAEKKRLDAEQALRDAVSNRANREAALAAMPLLVVGSQGTARRRSLPGVTPGQVRPEGAREAPAPSGALPGPVLLDPGSLGQAASP
ncbi:hypothetical protein QMO56_25815 [Roseomonas sp. E05]|uniref:hypothetical protein n=1 Tax=Roseomonas sp. E05 TaxID=3046310 RepID=UPI0024BAC76C|nr:hypothetical protein [Roseomonas sp. E05]MDJ0391525.1 hypothetical protein [Roseomonas sp. E05]